MFSFNLLKNYRTYYTFEKRYYVIDQSSRLVCLCVCVSVCLSMCLSVSTIVARWLDLATQYYVRVLLLTTARQCNLFKVLCPKVKVIWVISMISYFGP